MLPEHQRLFPGTPETRTHLNGLNHGFLKFQAILSFQMSPFMIFTLKYRVFQKKLYTWHFFYKHARKLEHNSLERWDS